MRVYCVSDMFPSFLSSSNLSCWSVGIWTFSNLYCCKEWYEWTDDHSWQHDIESPIHVSSWKSDITWHLLPLMFLCHTQLPEPSPDPQSLAGRMPLKHHPYCLASWTFFGPVKETNRSITDIIWEVAFFTKVEQKVHHRSKPQSLASTFAEHSCILIGVQKCEYRLTDTNAFNTYNTSLLTRLLPCRKTRRENGKAYHVPCEHNKTIVHAVHIHAAL